jgi:hypothetical protein
MVMRLLLFALLLSLGISACRHPIEIVGEGDVMSATGNRDCLLEDFQERLANCVNNDVVEAYAETYYAVPRTGWQFGGWGHYCATKSGDEGCSFNISAAQVEEYIDETMPSLVAYFRREVTTAHKAVLMGHSFFDPIASNMPPYFRNAGFGEHTQKNFSAGGSGGAPISFWEESGANNKGIKNALDEGDVTLLGMTYYPLDDINRNFRGFKNWVEYARKNNPGITVFLSIAWPREPSAYELKEYRDPWIKTYHEEIHAYIDTLRKDFPNNRFYCIPYGLAGIELKKLFEAGALPEITSLVGDYNTAVFSDDMGHANQILIELSSLMWLRAIYGTDLLNYDHSSSYSRNLPAIAQKLLARHDHRYSSP